jgi:hypothetical protein
MAEFNVKIWPYQTFFTPLWLSLAYEIYGK